MRFRHIILMLALALAAPFARAADNFSCEYLFGQATTIFEKDERALDRFWQDDQYLVSATSKVGSESTNIYLRELSSGIEKKFTVPGHADSAQRMGDLVTFLSVQDQKWTFRALDTHTGQVRTLGPALDDVTFPLQRMLQPNTGPNPIHMIFPLDPITGKAAMADGKTLHVIGAASGAHRTIDLGVKPRLIHQMPGSGKLFVESDEAAPFLVDLETGLQTVIPGRTPTDYRFGHFQDGKIYLKVQGPKGTEEKRPRGFQRFDLGSGESRIVYTEVPLHRSIDYTPAGTVVRDDSKGYWRINFERGVTEKMFGPVMDDYFESLTSVSPDGNKIFWYDAHQQKYKVYDHSNRSTKEFPLQEMAAQTAGFSHSGNQIALGVGTPDVRKVEIIDLRTSELRSGVVGNASPGQSKGLVFSQDDRRVILGGQHEPVMVDAKTLRELKGTGKAPSSPRAPLATLAETGGLQLSEDFPEIQKFFSTKQYREDPKLAQRLLFQVLHESPMTFETIVQRHPDIAELSRGRSVQLDKIPARKLAELVTSAGSYLERKLAKSLEMAGGRTYMTAWKELEPLGPLLSQLPEDVRKDAVNRIAGSLANGALAVEFPGVFHQKLFKFAKQRLRPMFGFQREHLVDLEPTIPAESPHGLEAIVLSSSPIKGVPQDGETQFGFYAKKFPAIAVDTYGKRTGSQVLNQSYGFESNGQTYTSNLRAIMGQKPENFIKVQPKPDYAALWKDKKLSGLVLLGENMHADAELLAEYRAYYVKNGFRFRAREKTTNFKGWLEKSLKDGELDYLVKEAHSDGMDREVVRFSTAGEIEIGTKALAGGKSEQVVLFHPDPSSPAALLPNSELGTWMKARVEKPEAPPLLYLNTSCYSMNKACKEIQAAATDKLVVFGAEDTVDTFTNESSSYLRQLISGVRQGKSYAQIRAMMAKDPETASGAANTILLPDDPRYLEFVRTQAKSELEFHVETKDSSGKVIHMDGGE